MNIKKKLIQFLSQYGKIEYLRFVGDECQFKIILDIPISNMTTDEFTIFLMKITDSILTDYPNFKEFKNDDKSISVIMTK